jgi:hypothetical protein
MLLDSAHRQIKLYSYLCIAHMVEPTHFKYGLALGRQGFDDIIKTDIRLSKSQPILNT